MALGIYKPGQGYWTRVLSTVFWGAIILAVAAYGWRMAGAYTLPITSWEIRAELAQGQIADGSVVTLERPAATGQGTEPFATATVRAASLDEFGEGMLTIADPVAIEGASGDPAEAVHVSTDTGAFQADLDQRVRIIHYAFPQVYLQAGVAGVIILAGVIALFYFMGSGRKPVDFLIATDGEMKKVNWSTPREIRAHTIVTIVAALLISGLLFTVDVLFKTFFSWIDVLQT